MFSELYSQYSGNDYATSSVLSSGKWFKIAVTGDGIYRIDFSRLRQLGLDNPSNPMIYCNNYGQLSYNNNSPSPDDLLELAIWTSTGNDGIFNEGDYLLFYGKSTNKWSFNEESDEYEFRRHNYSDTAYYFITSGPAPGKKVINAEEPVTQADYYSSASDALFIHEFETENIIKSGREWYQPVSYIKSSEINPGFSNIITSEEIKYTIRVLARASVKTIFRFYQGESILESLLVNEVNLSSNTGTFAQIVKATGSALPANSSPLYEMRFFNNGETGAKAWIDYVMLQGRKLNTFTGSTAQYTDSKSFREGNVTEFTIRSTVDGPLVWDISDPFNIKNTRYVKTGENIKFKCVTDTLRTFMVFTPDKALIPLISSRVVPNQDLHASEETDMIIITHPLFKDYAHRLANLHRANSGLISLVVTPEQIYNEFSGGIPDIAAIRNFVRMKFLKQQDTGQSLKYLLLFGDGSYENKTLPPKNPNFIPTYQSQNSNVFISSFTSDDFYGLLGDDEGEDIGTEDIGIGRLPVSDTIQAGIVLSKIAGYMDPSNRGEWKNVVCLIADDEDGNTHMIDTEGLEAELKESAPILNVDKIYLDAFRQSTTASGQSYPDVTKAINDRISSGCLIFNYVGHGNEIGLAHERVVKTEDINSWRNKTRLPLFITATCEFSRFDDIEMNIVTGEMTNKSSAGEKVLLNRNGGGIALMSTTRLAYSAPNYSLNRNIFDAAFDRDSAGNFPRLGDIIRLAKNRSGGGQNKRNFLLLGDPALRLAYPRHGQVVTDSINNIAVTGNIDTLKALSLVTIKGHVEDTQGNLMTDFNGVIAPVIFDKAVKIRTLANDGGPTMEFELRRNILFNGRTTGFGGRFKYTLMVPRDIDYNYGNGKISYYAFDETREMNGSFTNIVIGGFNKTTLSDTSGPDIRLYLNDTLFRSGGITDPYPKLLAIIEDEGGINIAGTGIGHDLTGYLDNDRNNSFVLNNFFENDLNNYKRGRVIYDLPMLNKGSHSLTLKAWDNFNNSTEKSIVFLVETEEGFILKDLINYPNPFKQDTRISAGHNRPDNIFEVVINIFNTAGKLIKIIKTTVPATGYQIPPVLWDGNDNGGKRAGKGIYPYIVTVKTETGETARVSGLMIIL
ncbi:MAG TPA: type IX secretion system sortase PorU [Bacteroidales bacterium]|nr:type IX secretion system sortase PorU [Bacteroidales bacterium]